MSGPRRAFAGGLIAGVVIAVALLALVSPLQDLLPDLNPSRLDQARDEIEESYFREVETDELDDSGIAGMVRDISRANDDRFSSYLDPATFRRFLETTDGKFSGIGLNVTESKRGLRVTNVFADSPAEEAGIEVDDEIVAAEGESLAGVEPTVASNRIKGRPGTEVSITVRDGRTGKERDLSVERAEVAVPAVESRMEEAGGAKVAYAQLSAFNRGAAAELRKAIEGLQRRGAEGIVLDLRGNGGGLLDEAVLVTSIFQEEGPVVTIEGRSRPEETFEATGGALDPVPPMVVLVDGNTASASEILTAALEENDIATVVGERTFGKGVFQELIELDEGGALDLTVGEYLTADGTSILGKGVVPDVKVVDENGPRGGDEVLEAGLEELAPQLDSG